MGLVQVSTYVSRDVKQQWERHARTQHTTSAGLLRTLMAHVLKQNPLPPPADDSAVPAASVHLRLRGRENEALHAAARRLGMNRQAYLLAMVRAQLLDLPTPTAAELDTVRECNRQLIVIGRNVNQIAHAVNVGMPVSPESTQRVLMRLLKEAGGALAAVQALAQTTLGRWTHREEVDDAET